MLYRPIGGAYRIALPETELEGADREPRDDYILPDEVPRGADGEPYADGTEATAFLRRDRVADQQCCEVADDKDTSSGRI